MIPAVQELMEAHGFWGELPTHPVTDWMEEVANRETRLGYWEWAYNQSIEIELAPETPGPVRLKPWRTT